MIASFLAMTMLAALGQATSVTTNEVPPTPQQATAPAPDANGNGAEPDPAAEPGEGADAEAVANAAAAAVAAAEEEPEPEVCHRRTVYDDFGRRSSRKVCTPRE